jgi:hypothetical protein
LAAIGETLIVSPGLGACTTTPSPRYIATWWIELGLLLDPQKTRSPGRSCDAVIGVVAAYCATE